MFSSNYERPFFSVVYDRFWVRKPLKYVVVAAMLVSAGGGGGSEAPLPLADMAELRSRLIAKDAALLSLESSLESSEEILAEWQAKYDRLFEAHRKLQKTNNSLEDKLLRIVDKFESDKNQMTRDLASQTQKLVQAKLTIQQLHDQNSDLSNDLHLSITLLQNRPSSYLAQRVDSLPQDMQV